MPYSTHPFMRNGIMIGRPPLTSDPGGGIPLLNLLGPKSHPHIITRGSRTLDEPVLPGERPLAAENRRLRAGDDK